MRLDRYDVKILQILHDNGRITKSHLAEAINLSVSLAGSVSKNWKKQASLKATGGQK